MIPGVQMRRDRTWTALGTGLLKLVLVAGAALFVILQVSWSVPRFDAYILSNSTASRTLSATVRCVCVCGGALVAGS